MPPSQLNNLMPGNEVLNGFSQAYMVKLEGRTAFRKVTPYMPVEARKFEFDVFDHSEIMRIGRTIRAPYAPLNQGRLNWTRVSKEVEEHGWDTPIDNRLLPKTDPKNIPRYATNASTHITTMSIENAVKDLLSVTGSYAASNRLALGAGEYFDADGSDAVGIVNSAIEVVDVQGESAYLQMSATPKVWNALGRHADVKDTIIPTDGGYNPGAIARNSAMVTRIAEKYGANRGVVLNATYDANPPGSTTRDIRRLWPDILLIQALEDNPSNDYSGHTAMASVYPEIVMSDTWEERPFIDHYFSHAMVLAFIVNAGAGFLITSPLTPA